MSDHTNRVRIKAVANALGVLNEQVVFVGGATISLYPTREVFFEVRPTEDVDVIIEILNYSGRVNLEDKLRSLWFAHDVESGIICRYHIEKIIVDIMPTNDTSIGFSNIWYPDGYKNAVDHKIDDRCTVKILTAPYFIATKLEAFKGRGKGDGRTSHDFEDIIYVLENRKEIWEEMKNVKGEINGYLRSEFRNLLSNPNIFEWIDSNVERGSPPETYNILDKLKEFIG